jgi:Fur family ferric uptake transcriptional regulator
LSFFFKGLPRDYKLGIHSLMASKQLKKDSKLLNDLEVLPCGRETSGELTCGDKNDFILEKNRERLSRYSAENKLNSSETREKILNVVFNEKKHFSIQDLVSAVNKLHPEIGFATIYRNVALFFEAKILTEAFSNSKGITFYELNREVEHDHVQCLDCDKIFEFRLPKMDIELRRTVANLAFSSPITRNVVYAHCELLNTLKAEEKKSRKPLK